MIDNDFPSTARTALSYLLSDLDDKGYLVKSEEVIRELNRMGRITREDLEGKSEKGFLNQVSTRIFKLSWHQVYSFCERVYSKLLRSIVVEFEDWEEGLASVRKYYTDELNLILEEENLAFHFSDGQFHRRGRAQTQKAFERVGAVLVDTRLEKVKDHYNKAKRFYDTRPKQDIENCVKEALCALEACIEILTSKSASRDFEKAIRQLEGNGSDQIPSPIGEAMIKLHGYRGSAQGVAHASIQGNRVSPVDAELVLSLVASYITYLVDLFPPSQEIPF
ncbi:MAG: hypothetical protein MUO30_06765 [Anaerolineales bacterium]|nr:hypothetical protein [Anaerolineales bacterium]